MMDVIGKKNVPLIVPSLSQPNRSRFQERNQVDLDYLTKPITFDSGRLVLLEIKSTVP
jgi:hypothetical protein